MLLLIYALSVTVGTTSQAMASTRNRYVYALIGAPCASSADLAAGKVVPRVSLNSPSRNLSFEEKAAAYLAGVQHDLVTMREFFGRGQDIEELFCYNHVDAQGGSWLREQLCQAFARQDVHAFFVYYSGHGYNGSGAWYLGDGADDLLAPAELFQLWQESLSGQSGESTLVIISDSCFSGNWVEAAQQASLTNVAVQSATDKSHPSFDWSDRGGMFTYKVYNRGQIAFQSLFSVTGFLSAIATGLWVLFKEVVYLFMQDSENQLYPQMYVPDQFTKIMGRTGGTIQPSKVINNGKFLLVDTFEWIIFR